MSDLTTETRVEARPYKPSWINRFIHWIDELPVPAWLFYAVSGVLLVVVQLFFLGLDGGFRANELLPVILFNGFFTAYPLALIHFLDIQAVSALNSMRPMLDMSESEFEAYEYRLSNMPPIAPVVSGLLMVVLLILTELLWIVPVRYAALEQFPAFGVVFHIIDKSSAFMFGVLVYHTFQQLRLVNSVNSSCICASLFDLRPLQAFSRLTASTAVGVLIGVYGWMIINPDLAADPLSFGMTILITILALSVFAGPLYGVHRLMEVEKEKALHDLDLKFEAVFSQFNQRIHADDFAGIEQLNGTISSLEIQQRKIAAIPTWPWRPETARSVLTAIALPLILTVLQFLMERSFSR